MVAVVRQQRKLARGEDDQSNDYGPEIMRLLRHLPRRHRVFWSASPNWTCNYGGLGGAYHSYFTIQGRVHHGGSVCPRGRHQQALRYTARLYGASHPLCALAVGAGDGLRALRVLCFSLRAHDWHDLRVEQLVVCDLAG